jgi:hypothetical protein
VRSKDEGQCEQFIFQHQYLDGRNHRRHCPISDVPSAARPLKIRVGPLEAYFAAQEREVRERLPPINAPEEDRRYGLLREYHAQSLVQSRVSFWFSIIFAGLGFLVIVAALLLLHPSGGIDQQWSAGFGVAAGTIVESVAGLFFVQSSRKQKLMAEFFDKLRIDRKLEEALFLIDKMDNAEVKSRTQALLIIHFAGLEAKGDRVALVLGQEGASEAQ